MKSTLFKNGLFLLNDGSGKILKGSMRVRGDRIEKIARTIPKTANDKVVDLKGALVIPGFVQTHVHLCQTLFRNLADDLELLDWLKNKIWPMEGAHSEKSLQASARLGIAEMLASGTTTILDMATVRHTDVLFDTAKEMGIRATIGKCLMDDPSSPKVLRENTKDALQENRALLERWHEATPLLSYALTPRFLLSCTDKILHEIAEISAEKNMIVHSHSSENRGEIDAIRQRYGVENIEAFHRLKLTSPRLVLAHCVWLTEKEISLLKETGTKVSHCPSANLKLASGTAPIPRFLEEGITVGIGADGAPCNNQMNAFQEMRLASLIQKPLHGPRTMKARQVFELATMGGARVLGKEKDLGSLEAGKLADFAVMDLSAFPMDVSESSADQVYSALVYAGTSCKVQQTWVGGRNVYKDGLFRGKDCNAWVSQAKRELKSLLNRAF